MPKQSNTIFLCQNCGYESRKWLGKCPECGEWNSLVEERVVRAADEQTIDSRFSEVYLVRRPREAALRWLLDALGLHVLA